MIICNITGVKWHKRHSKVWRAIMELCLRVLSIVENFCGAVIATWIDPIIIVTRQLYF